MALTINVDLGGRTPEPITWSKEMAKKKLIEYLFVDYLDEQKYGKEYNLIKRFSRIYSPKKVAKNSRAVKGFTKSAYKDIFKDQKVVLDFDCLRPYYNDLEMGDIIKFENWDSKIKIYGTAMGTDYYIVQSISKTPSTSSIKAIKVS